MSFSPRSLCAVVVMASAPLWGDAGAATVRYGASLTPSDHLGRDSGGHFHYDLYALSVGATTTVSVAMTSADFAPWLGAWDRELLPASRWEEASPTVYNLALAIDSAHAAGETASLTFQALPGIPYQVAVATAGYGPTGVASYQLDIESARDVEVRVTPVPLPAGFSLLLAALPALLALGRRQKCDSVPTPEGETPRPGDGPSGCAPALRPPPGGGA